MEGVSAVLIKYLCECCDRLVEEVLVSEELVNVLKDDDSASALTGLTAEAIMGLERQGSLVLNIVCPECLNEMECEAGGTLALKTQIIN